MDNSNRPSNQTTSPFAPVAQPVQSPRQPQPPIQTPGLHVMNPHAQGFNVYPPYYVNPYQANHYPVFQGAPVQQFNGQAHAPQGPISNSAPAQTTATQRYPQTAFAVSMHVSQANQPGNPTTTSSPAETTTTVAPPASTFTGVAHPTPHAGHTSPSQHAGHPSPLQNAVQQPQVPGPQYPGGVAPLSVPETAALPNIPKDAEVEFVQQFRCDSCFVFPIIGTRFKCLVCEDFDLCAECARRGKHNASHKLIEHTIVDGDRIEELTRTSPPPVRVSPPPAVARAQPRRRAAQQAPAGHAMDRMIEILNMSDIGQLSASAASTVKAEKFLRIHNVAVAAAKQYFKDRFPNNLEQAPSMSDNAKMTLTLSCMALSDIAIPVTGKLKRIRARGNARWDDVLPLLNAVVAGAKEASSSLPSFEVAQTPKSKRGRAKVDLDQISAMLCDKTIVKVNDTVHDTLLHVKSMVVAYFSSMDAALKKSDSDVVEQVDKLKDAAVCSIDMVMERLAVHKRNETYRDFVRTIRKRKTMPIDDEVSGESDATEDRSPAIGKRKRSSSEEETIVESSSKSNRPPSSRREAHPLSKEDQLAELRREVKRLNHKLNSLVRIVSACFGSIGSDINGL